MLVVRAARGGSATSGDAWADVHVFHGAGALIHAGSAAFTQPQQTADPGLLVWEDQVYQARKAAPGSGV